MPVDDLERHGRSSLLDIIRSQRLEIARHERDFNEQAKTLRIVQARCTELLLENRELRANDLLPHWTCASCGAFNGEAKEKLSACRCCGTACAR